MSDKKLLLGVNVDHIATVRQARKIAYPDPAQAALIAEKAGADGITAHLREDRRHIQESDILNIQKLVKIPLNLEMALTPEMLDFALKVNPPHCCIVPEKRQELTTEGGLDVIQNQADLQKACELLQTQGTEVSLFIDPEFKQIDAAKQCQARAIEIHTGAYADAKTEKDQQEELQRIREAAYYAAELGFVVNAGHGLHYQNVQAISKIDVLHELNIGHSIIAKATLVGMEQAVKEMIECLSEA